eukprot:g11793.t1
MNYRITGDFRLAVSAGQSAEYLASEHRLVWNIKKFQGGTEAAIKCRVTLSAPISNIQNIKKEVGPVSLTYEIPMYNVSNLQVRYLRIAERHKSYNPCRWVRYVTQSSSYVCHTRAADHMFDKFTEGAPGHQPGGPVQEEQSPLFDDDGPEIEKEAHPRNLPRLVGELPSDRTARRRALESRLRIAHAKVGMIIEKPMLHGRCAILGLMVLALIRTAAVLQGNVPGYSVYAMHFLTTSSDIICVICSIPLFTFGTRGEQNPTLSMNTLY